MKKILFIFFAMSKLLGAVQVPWTWTYSVPLHVPSLMTTLYLKSKDMGYDVHNKFSQLMFSWNAVRPQQGFFRFSVRVYGNETKGWSSWYPMMEWGAGVQRSLVKKGIDPTSEYLYVRLEMLKGYTAQDFQIKIEAVGGADIGLLKLVTVCVSRLSLFEHENTSCYASYPSVYIEGVPQRSQMVLDHPRNKVFCSPTSLSMLASYLIKSEIDPILFAQGVYDNGFNAYGSWPFNIAHAYEYCGGSVFFRVMRLSSFADLYDYLTRAIPVVVSVRGDLAGAPQPYPHGHLIIVIGYDAIHRRVICHDPAHPTNEETLVSYGLADFLTAWERSHRLAYQASPGQGNFSSTPRTSNWPNCKV
jgi:hypothetical protein